MITLLFNPRCRRGHAGDRRDVFRPRPALVFVRAAEHDGLNRQSAAQEKQTCAFGSIEFVGRETGSIDQRHFDLRFPKRLHDVAVKERAFAPANLGDFAQWLDHASFVVRGHDGNEARFRPNRIGQLIQIDNSVARNIQPRYFEAFAFFQVLDRVQHGVMLGFV